MAILLLYLEMSLLLILGGHDNHPLYNCSKLKTEQKQYFPISKHNGWRLLRVVLRSLISEH